MLKDRRAILSGNNKVDQFTFLFLCIKLVCMYVYIHILFIHIWFVKGPKLRLNYFKMVGKTIHNVCFPHYYSCTYIRVHTNIPTLHNCTDHYFFCVCSLKNGFEDRL
jgi:hypothetical protein